MRIINLIENTEGGSGCSPAHGLSFYVETGKHRLLLDLGPSAETVINAEKLGIDLGAVDTVVLSHGHYDHSGGILAFAEKNDKAVIYMQRSAAGEYFSDDGVSAEGERYRYIGIDRRIAGLPQVKFIDGDFRIDDELSLFTIGNRTHPLPSANRRLKTKTDQGFIPDDFRHEHFLVVSADGKHILMSGCAHNGILSILDAFRVKYGFDPDAVISGFHLMKKDPYNEEELREIRDIAAELQRYHTRFVTCHCTGVPAYEVMKGIMGSQLSYVHSGDEIDAGIF